jgi:hypothetical protein
LRRLARTIGHGASCTAFRTRAPRNCAPSDPLTIDSWDPWGSSDLCGRFRLLYLSSARTAERRSVRSVNERLVGPLGERGFAAGAHREQALDPARSTRCCSRGPLGRDMVAGGSRPRAAESARVLHSLSQANGMEWLGGAPATANRKLAARRAVTQPCADRRARTAGDRSWYYTQNNDHLSRAVFEPNISRAVANGNERSRQPARRAPTVVVREYPGCWRPLGLPKVECRASVCF